jgi:pimeloyl-ACP methyl ester carboxylesterase
MANKNSFYHKHVSEKLVTELGYTTFRFDHTGNGESEPTLTADGEQFRNMMSGFWEDVDDVNTTVNFLQSEHGLSTHCIIGHSRGGQVVHMYAAKYPGAVPNIVGVHMRYNLEYWRATWKKHVEEEGHWTLSWKNRGAAVKHVVSKEDADMYAEVPMDLVSNIQAAVLNVYGFVPGESQAFYDTGDAVLTDGVVPLADVEEPANRIANHTVRFLPGVGHYYREEGAFEKLWHVVRDFLQRPRARM